MARHYRIARSLTPSAGPRKTLARGARLANLGDHARPVFPPLVRIEVAQEFLTRPVARTLGPLQPALSINEAQMKIIGSTIGQKKITEESPMKRHTHIVLDVHGDTRHTFDPESEVVEVREAMRRFDELLKTHIAARRLGYTSVAGWLASVTAGDANDPKANIGRSIGPCSESVLIAVLYRGSNALFQRPPGQRLVATPAEARRAFRG